MNNNDWKRVPIKEAFLGLFDGPHATPKPSDDGPVFLGIKNITDDGQFDFSEIRHISEKEFPKWTRRITPQPGDIVFTYEATLNRYAVIPEGFRGCLGRRLALIRPDPSKVDTRFLFYYFFGDDWRSTIRQNILTGSTVDRIPLTTFPEFEISIPNINLQRKIASILSAYDALIENNTRRIAILEEMAQRLYREWFVHFRFPGHEDVPLVEVDGGNGVGGDGGKIPAGWQLTPLLELANVTYGYPFKSKQFSDGPEGMPIIRIRNVKTNSTETYTSEEADDKFIVHDGDILVGMDGDFHMCRWANGHAYLVQRVARFRPKLNLPWHYLYLALKDPIEYFNRTITGTTVAHLGHKHIKTVKIALPDADIMQKTGDIFEPLFELEMNLRQKNDLLRQTRDLLLPRLISGELDVSHLDIAVT